MLASAAHKGSTLCNAKSLIVVIVINCIVGGLMLTSSRARPGMSKQELTGALYHRAHALVAPMRNSPWLQSNRTELGFILAETVSKKLVQTTTSTSTSSLGASSGPGETRSVCGDKKPTSRGPPVVAFGAMYDGPGFEYSFFLPIACRVWSNYGVLTSITLTGEGWDTPMGQLIVEELRAVNGSTLHFMSAGDGLGAGLSRAPK